MSYLPLNNLGSTTNVDSNNKPIAIPRIEDTNSQPITLVFDAQTVGWRNVIEMYENDVAEIILQDNVTIGQNTVPNIFVPGSNISASCPDGQQFYDPVCGRWSLWNGGQSYVSNCIYEWTTGPICGSHCCEEDALGTCWDFFSSSGPCYNSCEVNTVVSSTLPPQYTTSGGLTSGGNLNIPNGSNLQNILGESCVTGCTETVAGCQSNCTLSTMQTQCQSSCANCKTNCASSYNQCFNACAVGDTACQGKCTSIASCESTYCTSSSCSANCATNSQTSCKTNCSNTYSGCGVQCSSNDTHVQACVYATSNGPNGSPVKAFTNTVTPYRFWFSARDAAGLMQRVSGSSTSLTPTSADYSSLATVMGPNAELTPDQYSGRKLYNKQYGGNTTGYLQYRFFGDDTNTASYANHTGGYVFQVKHTKCIRQLGNVISDTYTNRGQILYVVSNLNPNTDKATATSATAIPVPDSKGNSSITTAAAGDIWFKIDNNQSDYKDSFGVYNIVVSYVSNSGTFISSTITPLVNMIRSNLDSAATQIFQNLICYQQDVNSSCQNFFNYVKAMLMLYIMIYGMMFLTGMVKVTHKDLVIRIVKV